MPQRPTAEPAGFERDDEFWRDFLLKGGDTWQSVGRRLFKRIPADPRVAQRFELFVCGIELANAFVELTDAAEQRARFVADRARRHALAGPDWPLDEDFLAALEFGMPPAAGIAMGFDRLAMIASGADRIDQVLWAST